MKRILYLLSFLIICAACKKSENGQLIFTSKNPDKGFMFPYYLFIPDSIHTDKKSVIIVEPNNSGFTSDRFNEHLIKARRIATKEFYTGNYLSHKLKYPLVVPVFPRSTKNWKIYTQALDRDVILQKNNNLERIDLQLIAMVSDAQNKLSKLGYETEPQILMVGFSASGTFVNRFTLIHPDKVRAAAAGGLNGILMLPEERIDGEKLNYPLGTNDFQALFNRKFDSVSFMSTPQYLFMGKSDDNDAVPFADAYDPDERELIYKVLGKEMQPERWNKCIEIYKQRDINANIVTYDSIGHEQPDNVKQDILSFFIESVSSTYSEK